MKKSKYLVDINKKIQNKDFDLGSAVSFFVDNKRSKFDETIEVSMNLTSVDGELSHILKEELKIK